MDSARTNPDHTYETRDLLMDAADALSPAFIKIGSQNGPTIDDPPRLVGPLRDLADEAVEHGTRVAIETMPFSAITTVPMGVDIVEAAGHPATGLVIDAWHVFRADTSLRRATTTSWRRATFSASNSTTPHTEVVGTCSRTPSTAGCSAARGASTSLA